MFPYPLRSNPVLLWTFATLLVVAAVSSVLLSTRLDRKNDDSTGDDRFQGNILGPFDSLPEGTYVAEMIVPDAWNGMYVDFVSMGCGCIEVLPISAAIPITGNRLAVPVRFRPNEVNPGRHRRTMEVHAHPTPSTRPPPSTNSVASAPASRPAAERSVHRMPFDFVWSPRLHIPETARTRSLRAGDQKVSIPLFSRTGTDGVSSVTAQADTGERLPTKLLNKRSDSVMQLHDVEVDLSSIGHDDSRRVIHLTAHDARGSAVGSSEDVTIVFPPALAVSPAQLVIVMSAHQPAAQPFRIEIRTNRDQVLSGVLSLSLPESTGLVVSDSAHHHQAGPSVPVESAPSTPPQARDAIVVRGTIGPTDMTSLLDGKAGPDGIIRTRLSIRVACERREWAVDLPLTVVVR